MQFLYAVLLLAVLTVAGCGGKNPASAGQQATAPALKTVEVGQAMVPAERVLDGTVEAVHQALLSAQTAGRVAEVLVDVNDKVAAGAVVMRLRSSEQVAGLGQAQAALQAAVATNAQAQSQFERIRDMYERKVVARATYDEASAARDAASAQLAAARAGLESAREGVSYTELRSPYAGVVTARRVQAGEAVAPGTPLMTIASFGELRVVAEVPQSIAKDVRALRQATIRFGDEAIVSDRVTVFPSAEPQSSTFLARVELPETVTGLAPGMHVKVGFVTGESKRILVPRQAVVERSELRAVYVVDADGRVALRQVRLGRAQGDSIEVIAGLVQGERIALDPAAAGLIARLPPATS
jgi:RND family efflux transporter MFP subunit